MAAHEARLPGSKGTRISLYHTATHCFTRSLHKDAWVAFLGGRPSGFPRRTIFSALVDTRHGVQ